MNISLRKFNASDWQEYRSIRLEALAAHPSYFSPSRDETKFTEADWKQRLSNENSCTFGLYVDNRIIGLTGVVRDHTELQKAHLVCSYIKPEFRKKGLSQMFYEARIKWAQEQNDIKFIVVNHNEENEPSMRAHQKFGFKFSNSYEEISVAGVLKKIMCYKLDI